MLLLLLVVVDEIVEIVEDVASPEDERLSILLVGTGSVAKRSRNDWSP